MISQIIETNKCEYEANHVPNPLGQTNPPTSHTKWAQELDF